MATQGKTTSTPPDLSKSFQRLTESAARLNTASDELSKAITPIEAVLKKLNLGVSKWYTFAGSGNHLDVDGYYWSSEIGYAKVNGKWCIALAERSGYVQNPEQESETEWAFNDAPRHLRIRAVQEIPKLLDALVDEADKVTSVLQDETARAREVAETLTQLATAYTARR
jgi:prefoldin subunit 5